MWGQCIALRGDIENLEKSVNPGNFFEAVIKIMILFLRPPRLRNAKYISPDIQNQIIEIIGGMIIQKDIVNEVLHAKYYSILVDEITSHDHQEMMPLVVRFVDKKCTIREEFLKFSSLTRLTGKAIASVVIRDLEGLGLDICNIRGQGL